jgi:hypothetical protein
MDRGGSTPRDGRENAIDTAELSTPFPAERMTLSLPPDTRRQRAAK